MLSEEMRMMKLTGNVWRVASPEKKVVPVYNPPAPYRPVTSNKENVPVKSQVVKPAISFNSDLLNDTIMGPNEPIVAMSKRQPPASLLGMTANSQDLSAIMKKVNA
jgi:hypothetical protein